MQIDNQDEDTVWNDGYGKKPGFLNGLATGFLKGVIGGGPDASLPRGEDVAGGGGGGGGWGADLPDAPAQPDMPLPPLSTPSFGGSTPMPETKPMGVPSLNGREAAAMAANDAALEKRRKLGIIPEALAGVGDALSAANTAYGAKGPTDAAAGVRDQIAGDIKTQKEGFNEKLARDPSSDVSKTYQATLADFLGRKTDDPEIAKMSAAQIKDQMPAVEKLAQQRMQEELKKMQISANADLKGAMMGQKQDQFDERMLRFGDKALNSNAWSSGAGADAAKAVRGVSQLEALMNGYKNNLTPQEWEEAGIAYTRILAGSRPAAEQIRAIVPHTLVGNVRGTMQWFANDPTGTNQQEFAKRMLNGMQRERTVNRGIITQQQLGGLGEARSAFLRHPTEARMSMEQNGLKYEDVAARDPELATNVWGRRPPANAPAAAAPASGGMSSEDQQAIQWAKANPNDPRAAKILKLHGI
jgi:hypothetical protein